MNPFTTGIAALKIITEVNRYNSYEKQFQALYEAGDYEGEQELIRQVQQDVIPAICRKCGFDISVEGEENLPEKGPFMIYANHQGFVDIFAIVIALKDHQIGFIAKDEWRKFRPIARAIKNTKSVFLVRNNPREAVKVVSEAKALMDKGYNMAIFPEGTRSRGAEMSEFKAGAYKFAQKANVPIVPLTVEGSYRAFEEHGTYKPAHIDIIIHPAVHIENMDKKEQKEAFAQVEKTVRDGIAEIRSRQAKED